VTQKDGRVAQNIPKQQTILASIDSHWNLNSNDISEDVQQLLKQIFGTFAPWLHQQKPNKGYERSQQTESHPGVITLPGRSNS